MARILVIVQGIFQVLYWYLEAFFRLFVPPAMESINGETILVTGAAGGIGREICKQLVSAGSNLKLVLWDINLKDLKKLAGELRALGDTTLQVLPMSVDISSKENVDNGFKKVHDKVGPVSILFNNAGVAVIGNFLELSNEEIEKTLSVNLSSHFWTIRQVLPDMVARNHGRIVCTASLASTKAGPHAFPYMVSKHGVNGLMEALKTELDLLQCDGIHCTTVYPYFVKTPIIQTLTIVDKSSSLIPRAVKNFLEPADVAKKAVEGMRRKYQFVYCPPAIFFMFTLADYIAPSKLRQAILSYLHPNFLYKDSEEQKRFTMPYKVPVAETSRRPTFWQEMKAQYEYVRTLSGL